MCIKVVDAWNGYDLFLVNSLMKIEPCATLPINYALGPELHRKQHRSTGAICAHALHSHTGIPYQ